MKHSKNHHYRPRLVRLKRILKHARMKSSAPIKPTWSFHRTDDLATVLEQIKLEDHQNPRPYKTHLPWKLALHATQVLHDTLETSVVFFRKWKFKFGNSIRKRIKFRTASE